LREEPTGEAVWKNRVWKRIEAALSAEALSFVVKPWYRRPVVMRLGLAAACLALAMGWWRVQVTSTDSELADYVYNLATSDNTSLGEQGDALATDSQCGLKADPNDPEEPKLEMEAVYDEL
jgi:ferric-dicitrate binding protein FerR (iron transport regulator)